MVNVRLVLMVNELTRWSPSTQGSSASRQSWSPVMLWIYQIPSFRFYQRICSSLLAMLLWTKVCSQEKAYQLVRYLWRMMTWTGGKRNGKKILNASYTEEHVLSGSEGLLPKMGWENLPLHLWLEQVSWYIDHSRVFSQSSQVLVRPRVLLLDPCFSQNLSVSNFIAILFVLSVFWQVLRVLVFALVLYSLLDWK